MLAGGSSALALRCAFSASPSARSTTGRASKPKCGFRLYARCTLNGINDSAVGDESILVVPRKPCAGARVRQRPERASARYQPTNSPALGPRRIGWLHVAGPHRATLAAARPRLPDHVAAERDHPAADVRVCVELSACKRGALAAGTVRSRVAPSQPSLSRGDQPHQLLDRSHWTILVGSKAGVTTTPEGSGNHPSGSAIACGLSD
jgi:hypothetical protein